MKTLKNNEIDPIAIKALNLLSAVVWQHGTPTIGNNELEKHVLTISQNLDGEISIDLNINPNEDETELTLECWLRKE